MTVSTETVTHSYFPGAAMQPEAIPFQFLDAAHLRVEIEGQGVPLVLGTDYVITGDGRAGTGAITAQRVFAEDDKLVLDRVTPMVQEAVTEPAKPLPAEQIGKELDRRAMIEQEKGRDIDNLFLRALLVPDGEASQVLPAASERAGKFFIGLPGGGVGMASGTGVDEGLRTDLAAETGGEMIGHPLPTGTPATDLTKINTMLAFGEHVDLRGESFTLSAAPTNFRARARNGKILIPAPRIAGALTQWNTYADDVNGLMIGRENLAAWWISVTAGTFQTIYLYGDSTVEQNDLYVKSHVLLKQALYEAGVNNCLTVNRGETGSSFGDLKFADPDPLVEPLSDLGPSTKLIVIKSAINDAEKPNPLETLMTDARAKLAAVRAHEDGGFTNLSILLMGPNSTYRPLNNQDAKWYEDLRDCFLQLCKEFDCAYFDTYAYLQQTKNAPGLWMDNFEGGQGLHPDPVAAYWIWREALGVHVFAGGLWNAQKANHHWNVAHGSAQAFPTGEPQTFPRGISQWGVLASDGWPADGTLIVHRQADGVTHQVLYTLDVVPRRFVRTGAGLVWTQWCGVKVALSSLGSGFANGWVNAGGNYEAAGYIVQDDGFVEFCGAIKDGALGQAAVTLPLNARPAKRRDLVTTGGVTVVVNQDGTIVPTGGSNAIVGLDGLRFKAL